MEVFARRILIVLIVMLIVFVILAWAVHGESNGFFQENCLLCKLGAIFILLAGASGLSGYIRTVLLWLAPPMACLTFFQLRYI